MKKWTTVETATTADGKTLSLDEHDGTYMIRLDGAILMSTRQYASEEKLAELACAHLGDIPAARVLIGGLGFGFTLRAALATVASDAAVIVAEIVPAVVAWNRNPAFPLAADAMADPRVTVLTQDVADVIRDEPDGFDSIILDVDNGPVGLSGDVNNRLYSSTGVKRVRRALRSEGCVAYWSAAPDPVFQKLMVDAGLDVDVHRCRSHVNSGRWHTLYLGRVQ